MVALVVLLCCVVAGLGQDPADSWLSYAAFDANGVIITGLNASWVVPTMPSNSFGSNAPGWWFGVQTARGDGALIQPILAYGYEGDFFSMFNGVYDWTDGSWQTSDSLQVNPGDKLVSTIAYIKGSNSYTMTITSTQQQQTIVYNYPLKAAQTEVESVGYFVLEHQPDTCDAYPANGECTFTDISVEVNYQLVSNPKWVAFQKAPACNSQATVLSSSSIKFTWDTNALKAPKKWGYHPKDHQ
eukprot:TRINITY_DN24156_c0_g1_i1.p1 TRINITY_DN24156_c0_g1~~TRINITY_DN24156_c0_g1_i1.p1  ORF type:complete len:242 (-),score=21.28 TRINITY_DN24156_c0_g1_i1:44-769(-)